jgi:two-component system, OmpR family, sensor histidine kinase CreC
MSFDCCPTCSIAIRFFLGYFLIVGMAAWFVLNFAVREIEPGVRQAAETLRE